MDISPLDIKLIRQQPKSADCVRCCAMMVFKYFNDPIIKHKLWTKLHVYQKHSGLFGGYLTDLGILAIKRGYEAVYYSYDTSWWDASIIEAYAKDQKELLKALKQLKRQKHSWHDKKSVQKDIDFLKTGGIIHVRIPASETVDACLIKLLPVILTVRAENFYRNPDENHPHTIVVIGKRGDVYLIKDPYLGVSEIKDEELLYAWMRDGARMLVLIPTPKVIKSEPFPKIVQQQLKLS